MDLRHPAQMLHVQKRVIFPRTLHLLGSSSPSRTPPSTQLLSLKTGSILAFSLSPSLPTSNRSPSSVTSTSLPPFLPSIFIEVELIYKVVPLSAVQQIDSVIHIETFFLKILFHYGLSQEIGYSFLCCTVGPCCLSILNVIVCTYQPHTPSASLSLPPPSWQP